RQRGRVAAAERRPDRGLRKRARLGVVVEVRSDRVVAHGRGAPATRRVAGAAATTRARLAPERAPGGLPVACAYEVLQRVAHEPLLCGAMSHSFTIVCGAIALLREQHSSTRKPSSSASTAVSTV